MQALEVEVDKSRHAIKIGDETLFLEGNACRQYRIESNPSFGGNVQIQIHYFYPRGMENAARPSCKRDERELSWALNNSKYKNRIKLVQSNDSELPQLNVIVQGPIKSYRLAG